MLQPPAHGLSAGPANDQTDRGMNWEYFVDHDEVWIIDVQVHVHFEKQLC